MTLDSTTTSRGRTRIGLLVPFTNTNLEPDAALLCPAGVSLHFTRMGGYDVDEIPDSDQMAGMGASDIDEPLHLLLGARPDVVMYGCTSATLTHGPEFDRALSQEIGRMGATKTVTAAGALVFALEALNIQKVAFASPYVRQINDSAIAFLADYSVQTVSRSDVDGALDNYGQGALTPDDVFQLGLRADSPDAQALVLSCTDMRSVEAISRLEAKLNKPVITSNQAMFYEAFQHLGIKSSTKFFGRLLA